MSESFDWGSWWDEEAIHGEQTDADLYLDDLEHGDFGGAVDGFGNASSDADSGL